jgi:hypothetical protein
MRQVGLIYCIKFGNIPVYIGQTINFPKRKRDHISESFNENHRNYNTPIHLAIRFRSWCYCFPPITWEILEANVPKNQLKQKERKWIKTLNTMWPKAYNIRKG